MIDKWFLYILECKDKSLYTGITKDIDRRVIEHNIDPIKGAKSLRGKRPVKLVYYEEYKSQTEAAKREREIKNWKREFKLELIENKNPKCLVLDSNQ